MLFNKEDDPNSVHAKEHENFGELMIHQLIETIEYSLGTVSNTASYLRLWALSLAHGQLSKVFLTMIFLNDVSAGDYFWIGIIRVIVGFIVFMFITFGVILGMDTMECFLHALRLHWVEFQNKFFKGDGVEYTPFELSN